MDRNEKIVTYGAAAVGVAALLYAIWAHNHQTVATPTGYVGTANPAPPTQTYTPGVFSYKPTLPASFTPPGNGPVNFNVTGPTTINNGSPPANGVNGGCGCPTSTSNTDAYGSPQTQANAFGPLSSLLSEWMLTPPDNVFHQAASVSLSQQVGTAVSNAAHLLFSQGIAAGAEFSSITNSGT